MTDRLTADEERAIRERAVAGSQYSSTASADRRALLAELDALRADLATLRRSLDDSRNVLRVALDETERAREILREREIRRDDDRTQVYRPPPPRTLSESPRSFSDHVPRTGARAYALETLDRLETAMSAALEATRPR